MADAPSAFVSRRFTHGAGIVFEYLGVVIAGVGLAYAGLALTLDTDVAGPRRDMAFFFAALLVLLGLLVHLVGAMLALSTARERNGDASAALGLGIIGLFGALVPVYWFSLAPAGLAFMLSIFTVLLFFVGVFICGPMAVVGGVFDGPPRRRTAKQGAALGAAALVVGSVRILGAAGSAASPTSHALFESVRWGVAVIGLAILAQVIRDAVSTRRLHRGRAAS